METKHTKGEWFAENNMVYSTVAGRTLLADLTAFQIAFEYTSETEANAKLIAAAPDLLDKLIKLYNAVDSCVELTPELLKECRKAIKKATE